MPEVGRRTLNQLVLQECRQERIILRNEPSTSVQVASVVEMYDVGWALHYLQQDNQFRVIIHISTFIVLCSSGFQLHQRHKRGIFNLVTDGLTLITKIKHCAFVRLK